MDRPEQEHWCYTIIVGSFNATLSIMERSARQKESRKENWNDIKKPIRATDKHSTPSKSVMASKNRQSILQGRSWIKPQSKSS